MTTPTATDVLHRGRHSGAGGATVPGAERRRVGERGLAEWHRRGSFETSSLARSSQCFTTVSRELGHSDETIVLRVYAKLGKIRARTEGVSFYPNRVLQMP